MEFKPWPKIIRIEKKRPPIFTEKIDGTNSCIVIQQSNAFQSIPLTVVMVEDLRYGVWVQSRNTFLTEEADNYGFAKWVVRNKRELVLGLDEGHHFGEWWGLGIQRGYGQTEKKFSLFNTRRWGEHNPPPAILNVVPILPVATVEEARQFLIEKGSMAAPGFMRAEGAVMYEPDTDTCFKIILDK